MKYVTLKKAKHLGVAEIHAGGKAFYVATYVGYAITKLFKAEQEAVEAARHLIVGLKHEPIVGIVGFDLTAEVGRDDKICFWQIVETGARERSLIVGTEQGALTDVLHWDTREVDLQENQIEYGMKLGHIFALYRRALERKNAS